DYQRVRNGSIRQYRILYGPVNDGGIAYDASRDTTRLAEMGFPHRFVSCCRTLFQTSGGPTFRFFISLFFSVWQTAMATAYRLHRRSCRGVAPVQRLFLAGGAWPEFYDCVLGLNLNYATRLPLSKYPECFWITFKSILATDWSVYVFAAAGL